jgi:hypothetical protein
LLTLALKQARVVAQNTVLNRYRMAWLAIIVGFAVSGVTVHFWNALFTYFFFLIGTGVWLIRPEHRVPIRNIALLAAITGTPAPRAST